MPTRTRRSLSDQERAERRDAERQMVHDAAAALLRSDGWQAWLRVRAQVALRRYSVTNQLLIAAQYPDATRVAGFKAWLGLGYCVRRGETALRIYAPAPPSKAALARWRAEGGNPDDKPRTRFRLTAVFDRSQVEALPAPAEPAALDPPVAAIDGDDLAPLLEPLTSFAASIGSALTIEPVPGSAEGFYELDSRRIAVESSLSANAQVKTALHEIAHALIRVDPAAAEAKLSYAEEELVVECVAHIACSAVGLDASGYSIGYLAAWSEQGNLETLRSRAELIDALANQLEAVVLDTAGPGGAD